VGPRGTASWPQPGGAFAAPPRGPSQAAALAARGFATLLPTAKGRRGARVVRASRAQGLRPMQFVRRRRATTRAKVRGGSSAPPAARVQVTARVCGASRSSITRSARAGSSRSRGLSGRSARQSSSARRPEPRQQIDGNAKPAGVLGTGQALHSRRIERDRSMCGKLEPGVEIQPGLGPDARVGRGLTPPSTCPALFIRHIFGGLANLEM
jgi:hypothetical protein